MLLSLALTLLAEIVILSCFVWLAGFQHTGAPSNIGDLPKSLVCCLARLDFALVRMV